MRNRIVLIILSLLLASPTFADGVGAFQKFSMGAMLGFGTSIMTGSDRALYDGTSSGGLGIFFRMAFPVNGRMSVLADVGVDGTYGFASEYEYQHRTVVDSIETDGLEFDVLWNMFVSDYIFVSVGPGVRIPRITEKVEISGDEIVLDEVEYENDLWLDAIVALGCKRNGVEVGVRVGYEFLGMYKETDDYRDVDINELRVRFYFTYWFGQNN